MAKSNRRNLVAGLVSNSASIIEAAHQIEKEIIGSPSHEKKEKDLKEPTEPIEPVVKKEPEKEFIETIEMEDDTDDQPSDQHVEPVIEDPNDISIFFKELDNQNYGFKTSLMATKHISMIKSLSTLFNVPMQAITYNIIDHWYRTNKPRIDKERKRRSKEIF